MASIYGGYKGATSDVKARVYATFDYSSTADSNGDIEISGLSIYFDYINNQSSYAKWRRKNITLTIGSKTFTWSGSYDYTDSKGIYRQRFDSEKVNVGTSGGSVPISISGSFSLIGGTEVNYTSSASSSIEVNPYIIPYSKGVLTVDKSSVTLGETVNFAIRDGVGVTYELTWLCNGVSGNTGLTGSGSWTLPIYTFEPLITNSVSSNVVFTLTSYAGGSNVGTSTQTISASVPDNYVPDIKFNGFSILNGQNDYIIMDRSRLVLNNVVNVYPANNHATIVDMSAETTIIDLQEAAFVTSVVDLTNFSVTVGLFPKFLGVSSYSISTRIKVTDSRGRSATLEINSTTFGKVFAYVPPKIDNLEIYRCDSSGSPTASGKYAYISMFIDTDYELEISEVNINGRDYYLTLSQMLRDVPSFSGTYYAIVGENTLDIDTIYVATITIANTLMISYKESIVKTIKLPTMKMPISFYDDGSQVGVSVGEMATRYDDITTRGVLNFSSNVTLRATAPTGEVALKSPYELLTQGGGGTKIFVQTTTEIPSDMKDGDILIVYEV